MALVLRYGRGNKNACKTLIAAEYNGVKVPLLETPEGVIVESNATARYVAMMGDDRTLFGSSFFDSVQIEQWIEYSTTKIDSVLTRWVWTRTGVYDYDAIAELVLIVNAKRFLRVLDSHFAPDYKYLVGDSVTLADIVMICDLYYGFSHVMAKSFTGEFPHVERYFWNLTSRTSKKSWEKLSNPRRCHSRKSYL